ncbi:MAG: type II restriction endonuclease [Burkholderiaceae bacterium]|nr:type II restriction endonuclease [Burkholderiaceae bacterium]
MTGSSPMRDAALLDQVAAPRDSVQSVPATGNLVPLIERWKADPGGTYLGWFLWDRRLKNFRSIRRGLAAVVREINAGTFGNTYRGSSLEIVVSSVAEQRQIFKGADHAFLWKPKLRIPDIYEDADNKRAFARLLHDCECCDTADAVIAAIHRIDAVGIKGLGPAVANLLYFIHPTLVVPFNTAIVKGYNRIAGSNVKLGRWDHYLALREGVLRINEQHRSLLSNDLGSIAGLLFDVGSGRFPAPPRADDTEAHTAWMADLVRVREESAASNRLRAQHQANDTSRHEMQGWLRDLGFSLGFDVWIASNDGSRPYADGRLGDGCVTQLAVEGVPAAESVRLINVIWLDRTSRRVAAAFEVEHSTSIHSGIVRMLDLALGSPLGEGSTLFLVAPDERRADVAHQLRRPAFMRVAELGIRYLPYGALREHRQAMARFGSGVKPVLDVSLRL